MEPISNADRIVLVLRQKLLERSKATSTGRNSPKPAAADQNVTGLQNVHALAGVDGVDDRQLGRALIQSILSDEFGAELLNEAKFQQVVDRVVDALQAEPASAKLLARMVSELRT